MADRDTRDIVLSPFESAYVQDTTKGDISLYVGPCKISLSNTERLVILEPKSRQWLSFPAGGGERAGISQFVEASNGEYIVLENPAKDSNTRWSKGSNPAVELQMGMKVVTRGPVSLPLWPGQVAKLVRGHQLRSNEYLLVRVYDEKAAKDNWSDSVMKPADTKPTEKTGGGEGVVKATENGMVNPPDLTMGRLFTIRGQGCSFYIPSTGVEVIPNQDGEYVRKAVTLERLEYCILLDEDGNKSFVRGPDVVFPKPTETFVEKDGDRKFKAVELNSDMGLYIKVITDHEEGGTEHKVGEELFITGQDQKIYFPRPEHAMVRYGDREVHFAVAIPEGEGRYVLDKQTGKVELVRGPKMFLPDPRRFVIVRRILDPKLVALVYPGNQEALAHNQNLLNQQNAQEAAQMVQPMEALRMRGGAKGLVADDFQRGTAFAPPRTITLNTKFDGAVTLVVWTGYAVLLVSKSGGRRVIVGPQTVMLEYDEVPEALELSTGTPKCDDKLMKTVYLRAQSNKVSDVVDAVTKDMVRVSVQLSYRVNFDGDSSKWFSVENYVKFLVEHLRSLIRNVVKQHGIEEFNNNSINIVRNTVLGVSAGENKRPGRSFPENGMRIYDLDVFEVKIGNDAISKLLVEAQQEAVKQAIEVARRNENLKLMLQTEEVNRKIAEAKAETEGFTAKIETTRIARGLELEAAKAGLEKTKAEFSNALQESNKAVENKLADLARVSKKQDLELELDNARSKHDLSLAVMKAEADAVVAKVTSLTPQAISALQTFGDRYLAAEAVRSMAPLALLGGVSVADVVNNALKGTALEGALARLTSSGNGESGKDSKVVMNR